MADALQDSVKTAWCWNNFSLMKVTYL